MHSKKAISIAVAKTDPFYQNIARVSSLYMYMVSLLENK